MQDQSKNKLFEVLGLYDNADQESIRKAYSVLSKKYKDDKEKLDEISTAYNRLMGYYTVDEEEEKKAASNAGKFSNFWYHHKIPVIVLILTSFAMVVLVINSIKNVPTDVNLHFIGDIYLRDITEVYDDVYKYLEETQSPNVDQILLEDGSIVGTELMANSRMKLMSLIASGRMDVVISDMNTFEYLAGQGLFMPLLVSKDETGGFVVEDGRIYAGRLLADDVNKVLDQAAGKSVGPSSGMTSANIAKQPDYAVLATDNYGETWIYGVKLEGTRFLNFTNITGRDLVISVYSSPFNLDLAFKMVDMILNLDPSELEGDEDNDDY